MLISRSHKLMCLVEGYGFMCLGVDYYQYTETLLVVMVQMLLNALFIC